MKKTLAILAVASLAACNGTEDNLPGVAGPALGFLTSEPTSLGEVAVPPESSVEPALLAGGMTVACDLSRAALGKAVESSPAKGRATYTLHDPKPGSSESRAFYITGFADGCARRVQAALVMFGSVELYEMVRYSGLVDSPRTQTDKVYAQVRKGPCGSANRPCTGQGLKTLARGTVFLQAYPRKGSAAHLEVLLHDGQVAATARR